MASFVLLLIVAALNLVPALGGPAPDGPGKASCVPAKVSNYVKFLESIDPGQVVQFRSDGARYQIKQRVAVGGHGVVLLAEEVGTGRIVALKVAKVVDESELAPGEEYDPAQGANSIRNEALKLDLLQQDPRTAERFAEVYRVGDTDKGFAMVFEWIPDAPNLFDVVRKHGPMSEREVVPLFRDVGISVALVHEKGLVIRDIKPANILKTRTSARVIDFGVMRTRSELEAAYKANPDEMFGTPEYMAPELILGSRPSNAHDDLWAFGVTLYEMLSGEVPFGAGEGDPVAVMREVLKYKSGKSSLKPIPGISPKLWVIVEKLLHRDPGERFQSALVVVRAFDLLMKEESSTPKSKVLESRPE